MKAEQKALNDKAIKKEIDRRVSDSKACNPSFADNWPKQDSKK